VIDLSDVLEERLLSDRYPSLYLHLSSTVKPIRAALKGQIHQKDFWRFWDLRPDLYAAIQHLDSVVVCPRLTRVTAFELVKADQVFTDQIVAIATDDPAVAGVLQSVVHWVWIQANKTDRGLGTTYVVSRCLRTFPLPEDLTSVREVARAYLRDRAQSQMSLTEFFNRMDDPTDRSPAIEELRVVTASLDRTVLQAYGWDDIDGTLAHRADQGRSRFVADAGAQREIQRRLMALNRERYEREEADAASGARTRRLGARRTPGQLSLVGED
jgi:hypothetical protein